MDGPATQTRDLIWLERVVPASRRYADPYCSRAAGLADRTAGGGAFRIAELGFGTGLNLLAAWKLWLERPPPPRAFQARYKEVPDKVRDGAARGGAAALEYASFEAHPMTAADMARAHRPWPELAPLSRALTAAWRPGGARCDARLDGLDLSVIFGDARRTVPAWTGAADVWFLDGFAPARNPEMWTDCLMRAVFARTAPGGAAVTYSAAGAVRRALASAGFDVDRRPGFAGKRHMTLARRP